jgi:hypothetical protein
MMPALLSAECISSSNNFGPRRGQHQMFHMTVKGMTTIKPTTYRYDSQTRPTAHDLSILSEEAKVHEYYVFHDSRTPLCTQLDIIELSATRHG